MSRPIKLWTLAVSGLLCLQAVASLTLSPSFGLVALTDVVQLLLLLSGMLTLIPITLASRGRAQVFWGLMALGLAFWVAYEVCWCYFELVLRRDVPTPFSGDIVIFLHLVPMIAALAMQPHARKDERVSRL